MGLSDFIRVIEGDAAKILESDELSGENFDMVFIDAAKGQYLVYLEEAIRLTRVGGIIIADNMLYRGRTLS